MLTINYADILLLIQKADHFGTHRTGLDIYVDDYDADLRTVYRVHYGRMNVEVTRLNGYDEEKHCWTHEMSKTEVDIPNNRGKKKMLEWITALNEKHYHVPNPSMGNYYLRDGVRSAH